MSTTPFVVPSSNSSSPGRTQAKRARATTLHSVPEDPAVQKAVEGLLDQYRKEMERRAQLWLVAQTEYLFAEHCRNLFETFPHVALLPPQLRSKLPICPFATEQENLPYIQAALDYRKRLILAYVQTCDARRIKLRADVSTEAVTGQWVGRLEMIASSTADQVAYPLVLRSLQEALEKKCLTVEREVMGSVVARQFALLDDRKKRLDKTFSTEWKDVVGEDGAFSTNAHLIALFRRTGEAPRPAHPTHDAQKAKKGPKPKPKPKGKRKGGGQKTKK